jgi:hypothetical protein
MSQIALTNEERIQAVARFGYTRREAQFLSVAALQSGFFLRRQYCQFIGKEPGGTAATLLEKVVAKAHATAVAGCQNAKVYHLDSRPFYAALGQEDNRNRRARPPVVIKNRLMGLDFVLDHPGRRYLATEQEKVCYFTSTLGVDLADLPVKQFQSPTASDSTSRFFVDKYPIFVSEDAERPRVSFCFVDEGIVTGARFESHLKQYSRLWAHLPGFDLVYISEPDSPFAGAENAFQRFVAKCQVSSPNAFGVSDLKRLVQHFERRRLYETGRLESFDRSSLIRLRNEREKFSGGFFDRLYAAWLGGGEQSLVESLSRFVFPTPGSGQGHLSSCILKYNYDVFGTLSHPNGRKERGPHGR